MSGFYLDANFLTLQFRHPAPQGPGSHLESWLDEVAERIAGERSVISALVMDETVYRLILGWLRDEGEADPLSAYRRNSRAVMKRFGKRLRNVWEAMESLRLDKLYRLIAPEQFLGSELDVPSNLAEQGWRDIAARMERDGSSSTIGMPVLSVRTSLAYLQEP